KKVKDKMTVKKLVDVLEKPDDVVVKKLSDVVEKPDEVKKLDDVVVKKLADVVEKPDEVKKLDNVVEKLGNDVVEKPADVVVNEKDKDAPVKDKNKALFVVANVPSKVDKVKDNEKDNASNVVLNDPARVDKEKDKSPIKDKEKAQVLTVKDRQVVGKVQVLNKPLTMVVNVLVEMDKGNDKENDNV
ncbi:hypothetical protein Tco_0330071, partial [Tanacetum coccineum]